MDTMVDEPLLITMEFSLSCPGTHNYHYSFAKSKDPCSYAIGGQRLWDQAYVGIYSCCLLCRLTINITY